MEQFDKDEYINEIIKKGQEKMFNVQYTMNHSNIFPNRNNPIKYLSPKEELILKITFRFKIVFLEQMQFLFAFLYSKSAFEATIIQLEKMNYIQSNTSRDYGKYWWLTTNALYYFYTDRIISMSDCNISADKPPSPNKLILYKEINALFAYRTFDLLVSEVYQKYKAEKKEYKQWYQRSQFLQQFIFPGENNEAYSSTKASDYIADNIDIVDTLYNDRYKAFIRIMKANTDTQLLFHYLKDYYNSAYCQELRKGMCSKTFKTINDFFNNIYRDSNFFYRKDLYAMSNHSERVLNEWKLYILSWQETLFTINRRNLINCNTSNKTPEELKLISDKIDALDAKLVSLRKMVEHLQNSFTALSYDKIGENDLPTYQETHITLENLKNTNIFITNATLEDNARTNITFSIIQPSSDEISCSSLFSKLEKVFLFYKNNLLAFDYNIQILVYDSKQAQFVEEKLKLVIEDFKNITSYALFLPTLAETKVINCERHFAERYQAFRAIQKYI